MQSSNEEFDPAVHRKRVRHYEVLQQARFLTFSCYQRWPLLLSAEWCAMLCASLEQAVRRQGFLLLAYVFMPEHAHLVVVPWEAEAGTVSELLYAIKRPMSYRVKVAMEAKRDPRLGELMVRERPGKMAFRFWQEGPGHDRNLRDVEALGEAIAYAHLNPVKRGLCTKPEEWRWSSARQYAGLEAEAGLPRVTRWSWWTGLEIGHGERKNVEEEGSTEGRGDPRC
jgi:putative transposase